jgi:hypothetical protein
MLVAVLGAPVAWMLHLLVSYAVVGLACAAGWGRADGSLAIVTAICLAATLAAGAVAYRRWRPEPAQAAEGERDVVLVGVLGAPVFAVAIVLEAIVPAFLPLCPV